MKVVYEDGEKERIEDAYRTLKEKDRPVLFNEDPERVYALTFTVTNPAIAEDVLFSLLFNRFSPEDFNIGIDIKSIELGVLPNKSDITKQLHREIDRILGN